MDQGISVSHGPVKAVTALAFMGITSWSEAASALAAIYSLCLIGEWVYRVFRKHKLGQSDEV